jgi:hypothetical protein
MTNSKDDDQQAEEEEENYSQIKVKSKNRPSSIHIQQRDWSDIQVMNQIMTPVRILSDTDLHQEFDFYANAQFKNSNNPVSTPTSLSANTYFDYHRNQQPPPRQRSATMFQNSSTPQFNIPSDANDFTSSSYQVPTPSSTSSPTNPGSVLQNRQSLNNLSLYFEEQQHQTTSSEANKTALLLAHGKHKPFNTHEYSISNLI